MFSVLRRWHSSHFQAKRERWKAQAVQPAPPRFGLRSLNLDLMQVEALTGTRDSIDFLYLGASRSA
jgi:hypothetical protein